MEWEKIKKNGFVFELEPLPETTTFTTFNKNKETVKTWKEVKEELLNAVLKHEEKLRKLGIKRIQIASIEYFYLKGITKGRFINLTTMHLARLLKR